MSLWTKWFGEPNVPPPPSTQMKNNPHKLKCTYCGLVKPFVVSHYAQCKDCAPAAEEYWERSEKVIGILTVVAILAVIGLLMWRS